MAEPPKIDTAALEGELKEARERLEKMDPDLRSSDGLGILIQIKNIKDELKKADPIKHEKLSLILKCECGNSTEIPPELQAKLNNDEDITNFIPSCECGKPFHISVIN